MTASGKSGKGEHVHEAMLQARVILVVQRPVYFCIVIFQHDGDCAFIRLLAYRSPSAPTPSKPAAILMLVVNVGWGDAAGKLKPILLMAAWRG